MSKEKQKKPCYFDERYNRIVHVFEIHSWRCNCGQKMVRTPMKEDNFFFYGKGPK